MVAPRVSNAAACLPHPSDSWCLQYCSVLVSVCAANLAVHGCQDLGRPCCQPVLETYQLPKALFSVCTSYPKLCGLSAILLPQDGAEGANGNAENNGGKPKRKRKRDSHQQELNKQAQHRYRFASLSTLISCSKHNPVLLYILLCLP